MPRLKALSAYPAPHRDHSVNPPPLHPPAVPRTLTGAVFDATVYALPARHCPVAINMRARPIEWRRVGLLADR